MIALYWKNILSYPQPVNIIDHLAWWIVGLVIAGFICHFAFHQVFSPEARDRRKRRRSYGKVQSRARRPVVTLNSQVPEE